MFMSHTRIDNRRWTRKRAAVQWLQWSSVADRRI